MIVQTEGRCAEPQALMPTRHALASERWRNVRGEPQENELTAPEIPIFEFLRRLKCAVGLISAETGICRSLVLILQQASKPLTLHQIDA